MLEMLQPSHPLYIGHGVTSLLLNEALSPQLYLYMGTTQ